MTPEQRIDAALNAVFQAAGLTLQADAATLDKMREAMRNVMSDSYIAGSNDNFDAMQKRNERTRR